MKNKYCFPEDCESVLGWRAECCLGVEDEGGITVRLYAFCLGYFYWHFVSNPAGFGFVSCGFGGPGTRRWKNSSRATRQRKEQQYGGLHHKHSAVLMYREKKIHKSNLASDLKKKNNAITVPCLYWKPFCPEEL